MIKDIEGLKNEICVAIKNFTDVAVLGMSGGADSTLVACLCKEALGGENVYSIHMPATTLDEKTFNSKSIRIASHLSLEIADIGVGDIASEIDTAVEYVCDLEKKPSKINKGNSRARARMCVLYGICHELSSQLAKKVRVIGTGNLSEDFIGYDTKGGDALADLFPIGELTKPEVYQLLYYYKDKGWLDKDMIDRNPSAGLWDGQTDEEELGYTYAEMESAVLACYSMSEEDLQRCFRKQNKLSEVERFVLMRHLEGRHKHQVVPIIAFT